MNLLLSLMVAVLFGSGTYLMLRRDLIRVAAGAVLLSNAANLFIMSAGLTRGRAPIYPLPPEQPVSDPLVQALTLTAIAITFGTTAVFLSLVYRVYVSYRSTDLRDLEQAEIREEADLRDERETA